ncbi:hypothetical protein BKA62DRAFT_625536 [Auriculariales sp. MPI-PUGE-AT-0066]|nr:hypothetical protein BKA62DRAFT_625536 [Auriculariales sp. MPI-PUGE-AT-0066]
MALQEALPETTPSARVRPVASLPHYEAPAIGPKELEEYRLDREASIFPSWFEKGPHALGNAGEGTMSAAELRTTALYHLPLTLTRLWGLKPNVSKERRRLQNYLHLVEAVDLAFRTQTYEARWKAVSQHVFAFLRSSTNLYPTIPGRPNDHLMVHQSSLLERFGPSRGWSAFAPERWNFFLQSQLTNHKIGM